MDKPMIESPFAIKWRPGEDDLVTCWIGPIDQADRTDDWLFVLAVNRSMLEDDNQLWEDLLEAVNSWTARIFEEAGISGVKFVRFHGGVPPMKGAS